VPVNFRAAASVFLFASWAPPLDGCTGDVVQGVVEANAVADGVQRIADAFPNRGDLGTGAGELRLGDVGVSGQQTGDFVQCVDGHRAPLGEDGAGMMIVGDDDGDGAICKATSQTSGEMAALPASVAALSRATHALTMRLASRQTASRSPCQMAALNR